MTYIDIKAIIRQNLLWTSYHVHMCILARVLSLRSLFAHLAYLIYFSLLPNCSFYFNEIRICFCFPMLSVFGNYIVHCTTLFMGT